MKWSVESIEKLKNLCLEKKSNKEIASILECSLTDIYAKRSQLGITIPKCKKNTIISHQETKKERKGLNSGVKKAFRTLYDELLVAIARGWTSEEDAKLYSCMSNIVCQIEYSFDNLMKNKKGE